MKKEFLTKRILPGFLAVAVAAGYAFSQVPDTTAVASGTNATSTVYYGLADSIQEGNTIQCFDWTYQQIKNELPEIAKAGFTSVQTSPAQVACKGNSIWYYLYQPNGFYVGDSGLGSEDDLKSLCAEADKYGINVIVDVVANHLAGDHSNIDSSLKDSQYWHWDTSSIDYNNRSQIVHGNIGMQDLNSENSYVQQKVKNYIQQLKNDGVDGIRWDAAKHICLPSEGCGFWSTVIDSSMYNYGEILNTPVCNNSSYANSLMSEYTDYMSVTDSDYGDGVLSSIRSDSVPSSYGNWCTVSGVDDDEVVYWGESHDTYSNDGGSSKWATQNEVDRAYAIVGCRKSAMALYFSRPSSTNKESIMVGQQGSTHFTSSEVAAVNHLRNACSGQADYYYADTNQHVACITRETGACLVLSGSRANQSVTVTNSKSQLAAGTYIDEISGNTFTVTASTISGTIGSTGIAVFYKVDPEDTVSVSVDKESCQFNDSITVNVTATNASSVDIKVNGTTVSTASSYSATFTDTTTLEVSATGSNGSTASKTCTYTKTSNPITDTRTIYLDTNSCSWFSNDNAVAAIKTNKDSSYTKMTTTTLNGKTVYTAEVAADATSATIVRMLPSGKTYNEKSITLNASYNTYTSDGNWSNLTTSQTGSQIIVPTVAISAASGSYTDSVTVTVSATDATSASYTFNGTTTSFSGSATFTLTESGTLTVNAANGTETASASATYTITQSPISDTIKVYFSDNKSWGNAYVYFWGSTTKCASWPGNQMTFVKTNEYGENVYCAEIPADATGMVISNGNGTQTVDITGMTDGLGYYISGGNGKLSVGTYNYK